MTNENKDEKTSSKKDIFQKIDWPNFLGFLGALFTFYILIKSDISELRTELKKDISELRTELKGDISELRKDINDLQQRMAVVETVLKINYGFAQKPCYEEK